MESGDRREINIITNIVVDNAPIDEIEVHNIIWSENILYPRGIPFNPKKSADDRLNCILVGIERIIWKEKFLYA